MSVQNGGQQRGFRHGGIPGSDNHDWRNHLHGLCKGRGICSGKPDVETGSDQQQMFNIREIFFYVEKFQKAFFSFYFITKITDFLNEEGGFRTGKRFS